METNLEYKVSLKSKQKLTQKTLDKISDAVYASIESELEEVRKDPENPVEDYEISESHEKA